MAADRELAALVALMRRGVGALAARVEEAGGAVAVLESLSADRLFAGDDLDPVISEVEGWKRQGWRLLSVMDPDYPTNLRGVFDRPALLWVDGALVGRDGRSVAVIGSRAASSGAVAAARAWCERLVADGFTVVSGLALGIDAAAHRAVINAGGRTVAVIGTGIGRCYPPEHASLQARVASSGAVVSQFWPLDEGNRASFPARNATMSGLALGTVVIEASERSGARIQCRQALAHGRPVFLREPVLEAGWARELARRPGVHVVREPAEVTAIVDRLSAPGELVL